MDKTFIEEKLTKLIITSPTKFGIMSPQHMVEHLTLTVKIAYKVKWPEYEVGEKQLAEKEMLLNTPIDFPKGLKAPGRHDGLIPLKYSNLTEAKENLLRSMEEYTAFFDSNSEALTLHPRLGWLEYSEWEKFNSKHFKHHFEQFGIW